MYDLLKETRLIVWIMAALTFGMASAQDMTQNIRGRILDQDSNSPLIGAMVIILGSDPVKGAVTDVSGDFKIVNVPVGRVNLKITFVGYEDKIIPNLLVSSGKEFILDVALEESFEKLEEVVVTAKRDKSEVLNEMALISARSFSVEETKRYAGSFNDPARLASAYAGVANNAEGNNDIIVRGNSSKGILWRLEGIEIPNPNHFANEGATGGPINALSSNMLSDSDFMSGAFAPEYGNALSGVFDMRLKRGNNEQREYTLGLSTLGIDFAMEGPLANGGSFIGNYRYSSLDLLDRAGIVDFGGVPRYQDLTYNVYLPINQKHHLSFFGLGGISAIETVTEDEDTEENLERVEFGSSMGTAGMVHSYLISESTYLRSFVSVSGTITDGFTELPTDTDNDSFYEVFNGDYRKTYYRLGSTYGHKFNSRNKIEAGFVYNRIGFSVDQNAWNFEEGFLQNELSDKGGTDRIQAFATWKFRITEDLTMTSGAHFNSLTLSDSYSIEPRMAMRWNFSEGKALSFGAGLHSKMETPSVYLWKIRDEEDGTVWQPNADLGMSKAAHLVLGYDQKLGPNTFFKTEVYYQHLYNVPVEDDPASTYSLLNVTEQYDPGVLVNQGKGRNYGIELTLEQYMSKGFYYLASASVFNSLYTAKDGVERKTAFANDYIVNFLGGKEFPIGKPSKNKELFINVKVSLLGGGRYTPIDLDASVEAGEVVRQEDRPFSVKSDDLFVPNLSIGTRRNKPNSAHEFKIDIQNVVNNQAVVQEYYIQATESIEEAYQLAMFPTISYSINF